MQSNSRRERFKQSVMAAGAALLSQENFTKLPSNLPVPMDDGACDHLPGMAIPSILLASTHGGAVNLALKENRIIVYCYPRTGEPGKPSPDGWDAIPGARGCTPQSCSMRDNYQVIRNQNAEVFGLSTQEAEYQTEAATRLHIPFGLLSDENLGFTRALHLPTFKVNGWTLIKRLTLVLHHQKIEKVFYPVFPPDKHGDQVVAWLRDKRHDLI